MVPERTDAPPTATQRVDRPISSDRSSLLQLLADIDGEGWNGATGTALLAHVRAAVVRPLVVRLGLRGAAAAQGEATAWEEVWLVLRQPSLRTCSCSADSGSRPTTPAWPMSRRRGDTHCTPSRALTGAEPQRRASGRALGAVETRGSRPGARSRIQ
jgi:hypothetical protein